MGRGNKPRPIQPVNAALLLLGVLLVVTLGPFVEDFLTMCGRPIEVVLDHQLLLVGRVVLRQLGIDKLRLGDLVAIQHADHRWGRSYRTGAVSIALCIHGDSVMTGHGPGIMTIMTCAEPCIEWFLDRKANIGHYFGLIGQAA